MVTYLVAGFFLLAITTLALYRVLHWFSARRIESFVQRDKMRTSHATFNDSGHLVSCSTRVGTAPGRRKMLRRNPLAESFNKALLRK